MDSIKTIKTGIEIWSAYRITQDKSVSKVMFWDRKDIILTDIKSFFFDTLKKVDNNSGILTCYKS